MNTKRETCEKLAVLVRRAAKEFEVGEKEILEDTRGRHEAAWARAVVFVAASGVMGMTQVRIGRAFRRKSSCVSRAITKVLARAGREEEFARKLDAVRMGR